MRDRERTKRKEKYIVNGAFHRHLTNFHTSEYSANGYVY